MSEAMQWSEFDCCECGIHVCRFPPLEPGEMKLCGNCIHMPGWHQDPRIRDILGPPPRKPQ